MMKSHAQSTRQLAVCLFALLVSFAFTACNEEVPRSHLASLQAANSAGESGVVVVDSVSAEEGFDTWEIEYKRKYFLGPSHLLESTGDPAINFRGKAPKTIRCPGPFDPREFNALRIKLISRGHTRITGWFERDGKPVTPISATLVEKSELPTTVEIRFQRNQLETEPFDALQLQLGAEGFELSIFEVSWVRRTGYPELEVESNEPELTFFGNDARRAWPVSTNGPANTEFVIGASSKVSFSFGIPRELFHPGAGVQLNVILTHESGQVHDTQFKPFPDRWDLATIPLDEWEPGSVRAEFSLSTNEAFETACLVSHVWIDEEQQSAPPTVLFITSDTHRADHLEVASGGVDISTPTLNALAARGVLFEQAWSTTNVTIPSHVALMTGVHPRDTRVVSNMRAVSREASTLAELFRDQGWTTMAVVSAHHLSDRYSGLGQGFQRMFAPRTGETSAAETVDVLEGWLDKASDRPLFIWLHLFDAHAPYHEQDPWSAEYKEARTTEVPPGKEMIAANQVHYRSEISYLDRELARILERPRLQNAVIAFTADHGEALGAHGVYFQHYELYPDTTHVPLILSWPGGPRDLRVKAPTRQLNLGRTLLNLAGLQAVNFPGSDLTGALEQPLSEPIFALAAQGNSASVLAEDWLFVLCLATHKVPGPLGPTYEEHQVELYNLATDPNCDQDLSVAQAGRAKAMRKKLLRWLREADPIGLAQESVLDQEALDALVKLGYSGTDTDETAAWFDEDCDCEHCAAMTE